MNLEIRSCRFPDDIAPLTELLHRAYAELAARGLKFVATHQSAEVTERRAKSGHCFVAEINSVIVGTITVRKPSATSDVLCYRETGTFIFGQFGVDPTMRGLGVGQALHEHMVRFAIERGASAMALDTAAPAEHLIALYRKWGYQEIGRHRWESTNYESVVMKKNLTPPHLAVASRPTA